MSMVVEKVSVERVRAKLAGLKRSRRKAKEMEPVEPPKHEEKIIESLKISEPKIKKQKKEAPA